MDRHMKLAVVLTGLSGLFLVTAGAFAYDRSTTQTSSQSTCGSMMGNTSMRMMGMGQHGSTNRDDCWADMRGNGMVGCSMMTTQANETGNQPVASNPCR